MRNQQNGAFDSFAFVKLSSYLGARNRAFAHYHVELGEYSANGVRLAGRHAPLSLL
jgi:hypothetical protein